MRTLGGPIAFALVLLLADPTPSLAGCVCKDTRGKWCAKTCYVCVANRALPVARCVYWFSKRRHRG